MKTFKLSTFIVLSVLFMWAFMPSLSARSSFSFNLNLTPRPAYVEYNYVQPAPAYVVTPAPCYAERVYYTGPAYQEVVVRRPYAERVYVQPHYHHWR